MTSGNLEQTKVLTELMQAVRNIKTVDLLPILLERATNVIDTIFGKDSKHATKLQTIIASIDFSQLEDYVSITSTGKLTHLSITGWDTYRIQILGSLQTMIDDLKLTNPPSGKAPRIFVSYRRADSAGYTGRLYDRLRQEFGANLIFFDIDSVQPGEDFVDGIEQAVSSCQVLLAVIGSQWLVASGEVDEKGLKRPTKFVQLEIATALSKGVRVIPILVGGAEMPDQSMLPSDISGLARRNAVEITDKNFHTDVDKLIAFLKRLVVTPSDKEAGTIPMPTITPKVGDKHLNDFLFQTFGTIKTYFRQALAQLEGTNQGVETSFQEVTNQKFWAEIFVQGKSKARCKVWLGTGILGRELTIGYVEGRFDLNSDNSYNELISAVADNSTIYLRLSFGNIMSLKEYVLPEKPNAEQTAEILWRRFINNIRV